MGVVIKLARHGKGCLQLLVGTAAVEDGGWEILESIYPSI